MRCRLSPTADVPSHTSRAAMRRYCCKSLFGVLIKILGAAGALYARRCEEPYRFVQNRSRTSVVALKSEAVAEKSKNKLSRDF